jgi:hypothetical protein
MLGREGNVMARAVPRLIERFKRSNSTFVAVHMSRRGHHYFSILASNSGFEFVFRSGHDHWSTISPSLAKRTLEQNQLDGESNEQPSSVQGYLKLAKSSLVSDDSSWEISGEFGYESRVQALKVEREILDISWRKVEDLSDEN